MDFTTIIIIYGVLFGGMYFLFIRPRNKERARVRAMVASMEIGDTVLTSSGFYGVLIDVQEEDVIVEFGNNKNCRIPMQKAHITQIEKPTQE
jgi:preprotein translocase subunit YajC